jgi:HEAT repeat protein
MTPEAKASEYVTYEWAFALGAGIEVIPILLEPTELHPRLDALQHLDFSFRASRPWDKLIEHVKTLSNSARNAPSNVSKSTLESGDSIDPKGEKLIETLQYSQSIVEKTRAVKILGLMKYAPSVPYLIVEFEGPFPKELSRLGTEEKFIDEEAVITLRQTAAIALGQIGGIEAGNALIAYVERIRPFSPHSFANEDRIAVDDWVVKALGLIGDERSVRALIVLLEKEIIAGRQEIIADILQKLGTPEALNAVQTWKNKPKPRKRF